MIEPLRSRCLGVRVAAPSADEVFFPLLSVFPQLVVWVQIVGVLQGIAAKEGISNLPDTLAFRIAQQSHRNLRRAILSLEACKAQQ